MNIWFTVTVRRTKQLDNGNFRRVSEKYLLAGVSFTDAETRAVKEVGQYIKGDFEVTGIARTHINDIFAYDDADVWYKVKVMYDSLDADSEQAKKVRQYFLVSAHSVKDAFDRIKESLSTLLVDFTIPQIQVSPIVDVFPVEEK